MDEDKINSDTSEKRKIEDDISPKPNPKRVKLVRPVFSPVTKPSISLTTETKKSDTHPPEISKSNLSDKVLNLVNVSQPVEKLIDQPEPIKKLIDISGTVKKSGEKPIDKSEVIKKLIDLPETVKKHDIEKPIDKPELIKKLIDLPETVNKSGEKPNDNSEVIKKLVDLPETVKKHDIEKPTDKPELIKKLIDLPETVNKSGDKSIDKPELIKKLIDLPETVKKPQVALVVPEEQIDISSDSLNIPNIFSEETKKELENLKKNIFKIEDDGSSSENDSQPKRPRLKRPTFVTSGVENKIESIDMKIADKTIEVSRLDLIKPTSEENSNKVDRIVEKQITTENKINNVTEMISNMIEKTSDMTEKISIVRDKNIDDIKDNDVEQNNIVKENMTEKSITEKSKEVLEKKSVVCDNITVLEERSVENSNKVVLNLNSLKDDYSIFKNLEVNEKSSTSNCDDKPTETKTHDLIKNDTIVEEKTTVFGELDTDTKKTIGIKHDDIQLKQKIFKTDNNLQEKDVKKEMDNKIIETKSIDNDHMNMTVEAQTTEKEKSTEENILLQKDINETVVEKNVGRFLLSDVSIILERIDKKSIDKAQNEKPITDVKLVSNESTAESKNVKFIEKCSVNSNTINEVKTEMDIECANTDNIRDSVVNKTVKTIKEKELSNLEKEKEISNEKFENDNKGSCDTLSKQLPNLDIKQKHEEHETQLFRSAILKAALMSKKSPESSHVSSSEAHDQSSNHIYPTSLETKKTEILPTIGQEAIINKIEAEIKITPFDHKIINNKKSQNKILSSVPEINISEEASSSVSLSENINIKHDDPPKWGSAKMNEVEKFLNDSNVTITPIGKSQETPKLGKITLKLPKIGNPEIKSETTVRPDVKSELIKKITNKQIAMGDSPLKNALSQPSKSFNDLATIQPAPKLSAEQIVLLEQQILNTPKKRGRPPKALAQQKQLLLQYQQQQQQKVQESSTEDEPVFHVPLFDMEDMSGGASMFDSFDASTPKRGKGIRGKGSRGRRGRGGRGRGGRDGSDSDNTSNNHRVDDERESFQEELNQDEETKQAALMEAERLRKEEERERKLEARKKKLKERNDALKEKKLKKKQKAEERRLQWHEKKRLMQEEKMKAAEMKKSLPPPQNFDDETRMSADCNNSRSQTPARNFLMGEDDLSISGTTNDSIRMKKGRMEVIDLESNKTLTVDQIAEYQWPLEGGELYMIQEQISNFLGVKSFKRKYPGLKRRNVEAEERTFLCDSGLVAESLCDLGLTVLYSSEVLDVMYADFPEKYEELREFMRLKHAKELSNRQRALMTVNSNTDGSKLDLRDRAMEAVANWNANLNKSRLESRKCSMDMQTFIVHYPKNKCKKMTVPKPKIGSYPLALLPGQFCDYYATYSSEDLRYLPLNTVMYGPLKSVDKDFPVSLSSQSESDDSSSDDSSDSDDSMDNENKLEKHDSKLDSSDKKGSDCKICVGSDERKKNGTVEPLINCSKCLTIYHPTCLDMTLEMIPYIKRYNWQCNECKYCAQCEEVADEDKMLFCDLCDRGYHIYCVGLRRVPEGRWHCQECAMCNSCNVTDPGPGDSKWFYEFKKNEKNGSKVYCRTLCAPCSRLWKKGHYCPNCMRCYSIKNIERMIQCNSCDRYLHSECISENISNGQVVACTICEERAVSRLLTTVPRSLIKV